VDGKREERGETVKGLNEEAGGVHANANTRGLIPPRDRLLREREREMHHEELTCDNSAQSSFSFCFSFSFSFSFLSLFLFANPRDNDCTCSARERARRFRDVNTTIGYQKRPVMREGDKATGCSIIRGNRPVLTPSVAQVITGGHYSA